MRLALGIAVSLVSISDVTAVSGIVRGGRGSGSLLGFGDELSLLEVERGDAATRGDAGPARQEARPTLKLQDEYVRNFKAITANMTHEFKAELRDARAIDNWAESVVALTTPAPAQANATLDPRRLAWLHVPKAGTSFANVLVSWGCGELPESAVVNETYSNEWGMFVPGFLKAFNQSCAGVDLCGSGHLPIDERPGFCNSYEDHRGSFVGMLRQPEQRALSGFYHDRHDLDNKSLDLRQYAEAIAGCSVRMLTGHRCGDSVPVGEKMLSRALERLENDFAFVGLTEEWDLSVCLFHKMFGGSCHSREFLDVRPGSKHSDSQYDVSELGDWTDPYDGPLYEQARAVFAANMEKYGASREECERTCKGAAQAGR